MSALLVLGLGLLLSRFGLEHADQLASVLSLGTAMFAVYQDRASKPRIRTRRWQKTAWGRRPLREDVQRLLNDTSKVTNRPPSSLLGDHSPEVDTVYVQQRVEQPPPAATHTSGRRRLSRFGDDELFLPFDQAPRVIPVRRPLEKVFDQHRHLLIEGGPGTGKSTMAGQICYQLARSWLVATPDGRRFSAEPLLPLFVTARALADHMDQSWRDALAGAVAKGFGLSSLYGVDPELLDGPVNGAEWLVVIDGLDEVPARDRETFLGRLSDWTSKSESPFRLLVTTRPLARHATALLGSGTVGHYTLLPFDRQALAKFANQWFAAQPDGPDLAAGFLSEVTAAGLYDVASVPLMATIAIRVYAGDPAAGLPRNRHDLYEEYLRWQRADSAPRRATAWSQVAAALRGKRADAEFAEDLNDRVDELLEVLAVERMATRRSLAVAATEWLHREVGPVAQRTSDDLMWLVTEALISTGLLSRRDAGPDFIHLTFAEHFAARRHAAELSESFDPEDGDWLKWLHGAVRSDPLAEAVLTRWTRDHRAEELLAWLLAGTRMHLSAAVRLVAEGASVTGDQLTACLAAVDHDLWAGRVTDPERILAPVRRFPAAPEVVQWLGRSFDSAPVDSIVWAALAAVLATRDGPRRTELTRLLSAAVTGAETPGHRLAAARALAEVAPNEGDAANRSLATALDAGGGSVTDQSDVATYLLEFEGLPRAAALRTMRAILTDASANVARRRTAAEALAEWDGDSRVTILAELSRALAAPGEDPSSRLGLAEAIVAIAPERRDEIAQWIRRHLDRADLHYYDLASLAQALTECGPDHREHAVQRLCQFTVTVTAPAYAKFYLASVLAGFGEDCWLDAIRIVDAELRANSPLPQEPYLVLTDFSPVGRDLRKELIRAIRDLSADPGFDPAVAAKIRAAAAEFDPAFVVDVDFVIALSGGELARVSAVGPGWSLRAFWAERFLVFPLHLPAASEVMIAALHDRHLAPASRAGVVRSVVERNPARRREVSDILRRMLAERTNAARDVWWIASNLGRAAPESDVANIWESLADDPFAPAERRTAAAQWLIETDRDGSGRHRANVVALVADRYGVVNGRVAALRSLLKVPPFHVPEKVDNDSIWQCEIDRNTANDCEFLLQASDDLDVQKAVGDVLLRVVGGADAGFELDTYNGQILSRLDGCAAAVRRALDRAVPSIAALVTATAVVPAAHTEISAAARRILGHPSSPPKTRRAALAIQLQLPMAHRALPVEILTSALTSRDEAHPRPAAIDRLTAAELLYELVANRAAAGAAIATITTDSTEALYLRRDAREVLTGRGGPRGRTLAAEGLAAEAGDERLSIAARCGAALRSVEIIPGAAGDLTGKLRRLIPGGTGSERVTILGTLLEIDPADEVSLVELIDLMSASGASQRLVAAAANQIADGTPVHRLAGGEVLERILAQPGLSTGFRLRLLGPLIRALPDTIHATVAEVSKIGNDDAEPPVFRARAAVVLCSLESGPAARIGQPMLWAILDDPAAAAHDRVLAGRLLLGFAGPHRRETREIMLSLQGPVEDRLAAAVAVLRADGPEPAAHLCQLWEPASGAVRKLLESPDLAPRALLTGAAALCETGVPADRSAAAAAFQRLAESAEAHPYLRMQALSALPSADFATADKCAARLWKVVNDGDDLDHRRWAAEALADLARTLRRPARDALRALDGEHLDRRARRRLWRSIAYADRRDRWLGPEAVASPRD